MVPRVLADLLVVAHFAFIAFVVLGGLLVLRRGWVACVHLPAACWGVYVELSGGICPLTPLENRLRRLSGSGGYPGGFIEHHLLPLIYPAGLTRELQLALGLLVLLANLAIYGFVVRSRLARKRLRASVE